MFGTTVARIQATDRDIGKNAEMLYTIISGDGMDMFDISADEDTQEGIISVSMVRLSLWDRSSDHIWNSLNDSEKRHLF